MSASIPNQAVIDSVVKSGEDPSLPHAVFLSLLREHVLPRLAPISAADQRQISAAFERERSKAKAAKDLLDSIALDKRESHLVSLVKKLEQSVRRDWHDGYESRLLQPLRAIINVPLTHATVQRKCSIMLQLER